MTYTNENGKTFNVKEVNGKTFNVKEVNGKFFYFSPKAVRWLPVAKAKVVM